MHGLNIVAHFLSVVGLHPIVPESAGARPARKRISVKPTRRKPGRKLVRNRLK